MAPIVDTARSHAKGGAEQTPPGEIEHLKNLEWLLSVLARVVMFAIPAFAFVLSIHQIKGGWDDGAITAAFSRTLAETGRFALTPLSENVEGFSSVSWVFLLAIPYYLFHSTIAILVWMKLLSAVSFLLALIIGRRLAVRLLDNSAQVDVATILAAFVICPLLETLNGMEMNLYMLLVLLMVDVLTDEKRQRWRALLAWVLTFALVATRFESPFLLVALMAGLLWSRDGTGFRQIATGAVAGFGMMELWRHHEFGVWMPNTVYAKMLPPYSPPHQLIPMLSARAFATEELATVFGGPLLALLFVAAGRYLWSFLPKTPVGWPRRVAISIALLGVFLVIAVRILPKLAANSHKEYVLAVVGFELLAVALIFKTYLQDRQASPIEKLTAALVAAGIAFGLIFGRNWGYVGRMALPCIPFLVLSTVFFICRRVTSSYWRGITLLGCVLCQFLTWTSMSMHAWNGNTGMVSISTIEHTGRVGEAIRELSGPESFSILLPDVGGSSLCCERLQILDSALLSNGYLAHNGYKAFDQYLHEQRPDAIETHGMWSELSGVYRSKLMSGYSLTIVDGSRLFLRNDIYSLMYSRLKTTTGVHIAHGAECLAGIDDEYKGMDTDNEFAAMQQSCLYISRSDLTRNGISLE